MRATAIEYFDPRTDPRSAPYCNFDRPILSIVAVQEGDDATENLKDIKLWVAGSQRTMHAFDRFIAWSLDSRTDSDDESLLVSPPEIEAVAPPSSPVGSLTERTGTILDELTTLDRGWDGFDGIPVQRHTVRRAWEFLKAIEVHTQIMPDIVPLSNGGLQLEWFVGPYEVEVEIDPSPSGAIQVSFECMADGRCVEIPVNDPSEFSGITPYFQELSR